MTKEYEAIIVLANLMDKFGNLNDESKIRCSKAAELFQKNPNSYLITSGWAYRDDCDVTIAEAFKNHLVKIHSIEKNRIICEKNSRDTTGDAIFTRLNIISKFDYSRIAVVTSSYHKKRAQEIFTFVYGKSAEIEIISSETNNNLPIAKIYKKETKSLKEFRRTFYKVKEGDLISIYKRLLAQHPYYNGTINKF